MFNEGGVHFSIFSQDITSNFLTLMKTTDGTCYSTKLGTKLGHVSKTALGDALGQVMRK